MPEDSKNIQKPKVILSKKSKTESVPPVSSEDIQAADTVKSDGDSVSASNTQGNQAVRKKVVVVKKKPSSDNREKESREAAGESSGSASSAEKNQEQNQNQPQPQNQASGTSQPEKTQENVQQRNAYQNSRNVLGPPRPNVKAGNLMDRPRFSDRDRDRDRPYHGSQNRYSSGGNNTGGRNNFSGAQARENAREGSFRDGQKERHGGYSSSGDRDRKPGSWSSGGGRGGSFAGSRPGGFGGLPRNPAPIPVDTRPVSGKKAFKGKKVYGRKDKEDDFEQKLMQQKKKQQDKINAIPKEIEIMESVSVSELARKMNLKSSEIIAKLMTMGMMVTVNQSIDADTATILASEYDCEVHIVSLYDETVIESESDAGADLQVRPPVVTIMGHVDHGKTKTLDAIRSTHVAEGEFGGITQHIGAYMVETPKGKITFLDTPGHEAFTMMRARGAEVTDIVVLVVAADDGVMPQTVEAINHAKDAKVPIIVAVNKIDKPEANPDKVKTQLSELGLTPEDWGGDTMFVHISALKKEGLDDLMEAILLQAEILELKANYECRAEGKVIESRIDHGRGIVATILVQRGTLRTGDAYVAGVFSGRVRAIFNDRCEKIDEATPSMPVEILGLEGMPNAGDPFQVTENERFARQISSKRQELKRFENARNVKKVTLENLYKTIDDGEVTELKVIIKGDVQGSVEALKQSLEKLSTKEIRLNVIHASAGAINDSDVMLAAADSNAIIIGFNVRPTPQAKALAEQEKVDIRKYNVIYKAVEEIELAMEGMLKPDIKEEVIGSAEVRECIRISKVGVIAGSYVLQGVVRRSAQVNVIREGIVVHSGRVSSLRRFKDDVKEVAAGFECGIGLENYDGIQPGDQLEFIELVEIARKLKDSARNDSDDVEDGGK